MEYILELSNLAHSGPGFSETRVVNIYALKHLHNQYLGVNSKETTKQNTDIHALCTICHD
jgi:hypothetical protein